MATHSPARIPRLILGPEDRDRPLTAGEFAEAEFREPWRFERVRGSLAVMSPAGESHNNVAGPWRDYLGAYRLAHRQRVEKVVAEAWLRVDQGTDRIADIGVYLASDRPAPPIPDRVPELVVEVVSPGRESRRRDYVEKRAEYLRLGVREYVVVDPERRRVTAYVRGPEGGYVKRIARPPGVYRTDLLPGLVIPLDEVLGR